MSYTYLLELGEESSAECFSGIPASVLSSGTSTPDNACLPDSGTDACHASQSGMTCKPSTETLGAAASTSSAEASPVRISASLEMAQESTASGLECGRTWPVSFARWARGLCSWKTPQCSLLAGLDEFSETWPRWGMMQNGECWERIMPEHHTDETESGYWPTLVKFDAQNCHPFIAEIDNGNRLYTISSKGVRATSSLRSWLAAMPNRKIAGKAGWSHQPGVGRMVYGLAGGMDQRVAQLGNGQVPAVAALAFSILKNRIEGMNT